MKPKPIPEWRSAWKLLSVQVGTLAVTFGLLPPDQQSAILSIVGITPERVPAVLGALFLASRMLKQSDDA